MFASTTKREIAVGEETLTIRKLSAHRLEEAQLVRQYAVADITKRMGGELVRVWREEPDKLKVEEPRTEAEEKNARNASYDRLTVLTYGIDSWTVGPKVTREKLEDLDEPTVQLLFEAILDLTFEDGESRKKDS